MSQAKNPDSHGGRKPNRLINEQSPYLRQHAYNPVDWYAWGAEALARAKAENKPIMLSIGYSACHWCHVMERESFENDAIAQLMNENFIPIKVDREERPDLDQIYMDAVQLHHGARRMAADDVPHAGRAAVFRRDLFSAGGSAGDAWIPAHPRRSVAGVSRQGEGSHQQSSRS